MKRRNQGTMHRLTVREVLAASDGDLSDGAGLLLRARGPSASWVFRYTAPSGSRREMGLGVAHRGSAVQAGESVKQARRLANEARSRLAQGIDPIDERDRMRAAARDSVEAAKAQKAREALTLARAARSYHEQVIEPTRTPKHAAQWIASLEQHVPADIWHAPIASATAPGLLDFLLKLRGTVPETASRVRQRLEAVFEDAVFRRVYSGNPAAATRRKFTESRARRERGSFAALPIGDAPALAGRIRAASGTATRCLEFAMLTAARTKEAIEAQWPEFDLENRIWKVPGARMKSGVDHVVHLSARAPEYSSNLLAQLRLFVGILTALRADPA